MATRIDPDGTMLRRMVDTAQSSDPEQWEQLVARALAVTPPYRPTAGSPLYHVSVDNQVIMVAEHDLTEPLAALLAAVMGLGSEI